MNERVTLHMQMSAVRITAEGMWAMDLAWLEVQEMVERVSCKLTKKPELRKKMIEEAMCKLWDLDVTRYNLKNPEHDGFIRQSLKNTVCDVWRSEQPKKKNAEGTVAEAVGPEMMRAIRLDQRAAS